MLLHRITVVPFIGGGGQTGGLPTEDPLFDKQRVYQQRNVFPVGAIHGGAHYIMHSKITVHNYWNITPGGWRSNRVMGSLTR